MHIAGLQLKEQQSRKLPGHFSPMVVNAQPVMAHKGKKSEKFLCVRADYVDIYVQGRKWIRDMMHHSFEIILFD